jgi:hypothetical protein
VSRADAERDGIGSRNLRVEQRRKVAERGLGSRSRADWAGQGCAAKALSPSARYDIRPFAAQMMQADADAPCNDTRVQAEKQLRGRAKHRGYSRGPWKEHSQAAHADSSSTHRSGGQRTDAQARHASDLLRSYGCGNAVDPQTAAETSGDH